ncbi:MAG: TfuA-like protein [Jatrophihabitans sp.]
MSTRQVVSEARDREPGAPNSRLGILYVGPSLRPDDLAHAESGLEVRPPIRRGDLPAAVASGCRTIGIIDGEFFQSLAVSPKEVLAALEQACVVVGGASMGALRAAELAPYGMHGVGQVFDWFRAGDVTRDDDVAVSYAHDDGDFRLLTVPMVNVRWTVLRARKEGWLHRSACNRISMASRRIHWERRTWREICAGANLDADENRTILDYVADPDHDLKRLDALATVRFMEGLLADSASRTSESAEKRGCVSGKMEVAQ